MIGDLLFSLMGKPNPQAQLAQSFGMYPGQAGSNSGPVPGPGAGAAAPGLAAQGGGGNVQGQPPQQQQAPPQPQAYTSPPDLGQMYMNLMQRQQANAQINVGLGLLAGAFSHNQADRSNMISAMENLNQSQGMGGAGGIGAIAQLQQMAWQRQMMLMQMQHLPEIAKQLNITPEMASGLFFSGKLGDVMQNIAQSQYAQGTPEYKANVSKALAETGLTTAQTGAVPGQIAKTAAETGAIPSTVAKTAAETGAIPADVALKQAQTAAAQAGIPKTQAETELTKAQAQKLSAEAMAREKLSQLAQDPGFTQKYGITPEAAQALPPDKLADLVASAPQIETKITTTDMANARNMIPTADNKMRDLLREVDFIRGNSSLGNRTGALSAVPAIPNTNEYQLQAHIDRLNGISGIGALDEIKGGVGRVLGQEFNEGMEAQGTLQHQGMKTADYQSSLDDYALKSLREYAVLHQKAGVPMPQDLQDRLDKLSKGQAKLSDDELLKKYIH